MNMPGSFHDSNPTSKYLELMKSSSNMRSSSSYICGMNELMSSGCPTVWVSISTYSDNGGSILPSENNVDLFSWSSIQERPEIEILSGMAEDIMSGFVCVSSAFSRARMAERRRD